MTKKRAKLQNISSPNKTSPAEGKNTEPIVESEKIYDDLVNNTSLIKCVLSCDKSYEGKINSESIKEIIGLELSSQYVLSVKQENNYSYIKFDKLKSIENFTTYSTNNNTSKIYFNNESLVYYTKNKSSITEHVIEGKQSKDVTNHVNDIKHYQIFKNVFENDYIHINHEHVLHTIQGSSISISLKKLLSNIEQYEYKFSTKSCLIYLDVVANTLFSYDFLNDKNTKLVTLKKQFKNVNISKYDDEYLLLTMSNQKSTIIQIWNKDLTTIMKYSMIKNNNLRFVTYAKPFVVFDKCIFKLFKFDSIKFTKAIQIKNRKLTNIFIESHKTDNGFVYSIHDSTQWKKIENELQQKRENIVDCLQKNSQNLLEYIKQLPLIECYQILLEYVFNNISNDNVLPCLSYLLSNYTQIERSDGMTSIHIGILNNIVNFLLDNYNEKYRTSLDIILKLVLLSDEQITRYINIYGREKYQEGLRLVLNYQFRNVQLLSMMKYVKTLDYEVVFMVLKLLKDESVHIDACMIWTQLLVHSHFGEFLLKNECLEVIQEIQTRIKSNISQLKQLSLAKSELGVITSGMVLPKKKEQNKDKLLLNGARWNSGGTDYTVSVNYF